MSTSSTAFTGSSNFSTDFQNVITRATAIASLPITQLNSDKTALTDQATALTGLDTKFKALQTAVQGIADSLTGASFSAEVSDSSKLTVSLGAGAAEGNYSVDVVDPGTYAASMTSSNWVAPSGATNSYQLSLGGVNYALAPADNTAASVVAAINNTYGDKVHATLVNVGSSSSPDARISLQAVQLGDLKPGLLVGPANRSLQTQQTAGSSTLAASQTTANWNSGPSLTYRLSIAGTTYSIASNDNTARGIADAINTQYGDMVTAAVVDVGSDSSPDLRINLTAVNPGDARPDILASDGVSAAASVQTQQVAGSDSKATSRTTSPWVAAAGPAFNYQLSLGGTQYSLTVAGNSIDSVISAINNQYGDKVTAAKVDLGTGTTHDYRISLTAAKAGDLRPDLSVSPADVQKQQAAGGLATYIVNNSGQPVTSATRSVSIADGITVNLLAKDDGSPVNITVTRPTSAVSDALTAFVTAYDNAVDEIDKQHGTTSGVLTGQSILGDLSRALSGLATYSSSTSSGISGLADLGLDLDKTGHLTFSAFTLMAADVTKSAGVTAFLGSSTSGFLKLATDTLTGVEDSTTGLLPTTESAVQDQITKTTNTIADEQARVDAMTQRMQDQMAAADALISSMEQQYSYLSNMFTAMQTADAQYK